MSEQDTYNDFESLCAGYVLDALTAEENREFEKMLSSATAEQREIYQDMINVRDDLALSAVSGKPREDLFVNVLNEISDSESKTDKQANILPMWAWRAAAAILLAGFLGLALFSQQLSETVDEQQTVITQLESDLEHRNELLAILESREVNLILMAGLEASPEGYGKIIWDPENRRALLQVANLPEPAEDKDYQLWLIKDQQDPISAGVFSFERTATDLFYRIDQLEEDPSDISNIFAVTLEPKGGMPQPTGDMYLFGEKN